MATEFSELTEKFYSSFFVFSNLAHLQFNIKIYYLAVLKIIV